LSKGAADRLENGMRVAFYRTTSFGFRVARTL
jgi:hypothetical protein